METEVQGQASQQPLPDVLTANEAVGALTQIIEAEGKEVKPQTDRNEKGQFKPKEEAKPEAEAKSEEEVKEEAKSEEPEIKPETRKFKLRYKGEEREVEEPEVTELAQKGYDYTQKMQQLAKDREEVQTKLKSDAETVRKHYEQQLEIHKRALTQISGVKSMAEIEQLSKTDPAGAQQEFLRAIAINQAIGAIEGEQTKISHQRAAEAHESYQRSAREAVEKLQDRIPGWNNDLYGKILKGGVDSYGFNQQEVNSITDPRAIEVLNDALKWREYQSAKPKTVDKKVASVPKVQKPGTAEGRPNPSAERFSKNMERLQKTGSRDAAVDAVRMLIEAGRL